MANKPDAADFSPTMSQYSGIGKFKAWVQMVLPQVYDDALSYQELVYKMLFYINTLIDDVDSAEGNVTALKEAYDSLQAYINTWFSELDVQEEVDAKLDEYVEDGTLATLIQPLFNAYKADIDHSIEEQDADIAVLIGRMNEFTSLPDGSLSTAADAEMADIRVAWTGVTYANAGNAVRGQCEDLNDGIETVDGGNTTLDMTDYSEYAYVVREDGTFYRSGSNYKSYVIPVSKYWNAVKITGAAFDTGIYNVFTAITFAKNTIPSVVTAETSGTSAVAYLATGETGSHAVYHEQTVTFRIPDGTDLLLITHLYGGSSKNVTPQSVIVEGILTNRVETVENMYNNLVNDFSITLSEYPFVNTVIKTATVTVDNVATETSIFKRSSTNYRSYQIPVETGWKYLKLTGCQEISDEIESSPQMHTSSVAFVKTLAPYSPADDSSAAEYMCQTTPLRSDIPSLQTVILDIPEDCKYILIAVTERSANVTPTNITIQAYITEMSDDIQQLMVINDNKIIPNYYFNNNYLEDKITEVLGYRDAMSSNSDSFFVIADTHIQNNEMHSPALLQYISARTGITKLFHVGDAGGSAHTADKYTAAMRTLSCINAIGDSVSQHYFILGNHEWNTITGEASAKYTLPGVLAYYLEKYKTLNTGVNMDPAIGNYWFDNPVNKVRYFFLQCDGAAAPISVAGDNALNSTVQWFGDELYDVPADYSIFTFLHYVYIPPVVSVQETGNELSDFTYSYSSIRFINQLLKAVKEKSSVTLTDSYASTFDYSGLTGNRHPVLVIGGHRHHGELYMAQQNITGTDAETTALGLVGGIATFWASTDTLEAGAIYEGNQQPWYWENGIINGTKIVRSAGNITEQCFYIVQTDFENKTFKITAIGGDHDYPVTGLATYEA